MSMLRRFAGGLRGLLRKGRIERELDEELRGYLEASVEEHRRAGLGRDEALRAARLEMGSLDAVKDEVRRVGWETALETVWQDIRYGARALRHHPGFACAAILTLALGIGANSAIFSVVSSVLLRPLPYPVPDRLVSLAGGQSFPDIMDLAEQSTSFADLGASGGWPLDLVGEGEPERIDGELVAGNLFRALGVPPLLGRTFSEEDDRARAAVAVVSHDFWRAHLGSDRAALGRQLNLSGAAYTVIGVMPPGFRMPFFSFRSQVWIPFRTGYPEAVEARGAHFLRAAGRLRDGTGLREAQAELNVIGRHIGELNPTDAREFTLRDLREDVVGAVRAPLFILLGAVSLVLLIACGNFASLLLARGVARRQEMRVRHALGAGRARLMRQMLTESALLSLIGGGVGVLLAKPGVALLVRLMPRELPTFHPVAIDSRTMIVTLAVSLATGLVFGMAPALHLWEAREANLSGARSTEGRSPLRRALVVAELALAAVLLIGAGLLIRSFWQLRNVALGFEPRGVLTLRLTLPASRYESISAQESFLARLDEGLRTTPGAAAAGLVSELPLTGWRMMHNMIVEGQAPVPEGAEPEIYTHEISPGYFAAMGTPLRLGRGIDDQDASTSPRVGVVNEAFVRRFFPDRSPLGARARWARGEPNAWMTIVGVAADARFENARRGPAAHHLHAVHPETAAVEALDLGRGPKPIGGSHASGRFRAPAGVAPRCAPADHQRDVHVRRHAGVGRRASLQPDPAVGVRRPRDRPGGARSVRRAGPPGGAALAGGRGPHGARRATLRYLLADDPPGAATHRLGRARRSARRAACHPRSAQPALRGRRGRSGDLRRRHRGPRAGGTPRELHSGPAGPARRPRHHSAGRVAPARRISARAGARDRPAHPRAAAGIPDRIPATRR